MTTAFNSYLIGALVLFNVVFLEKDTSDLSFSNSNSATSISDEPELPTNNTLEIRETRTVEFMPVACSAGTNQVKFIQCYDESHATPETDRNDYFVCCAPPTWMPSEGYEFDADPIEDDYPCVAGADIDGIKLTIVIQSVDINWGMYSCCEAYLEGLYANIYDNCTANTCQVLGDGLDSSSPGSGDCSANGENLNYVGGGNFTQPLPYTSVTDCLGPFFTTDESIGIDIIPSIKFDEADAAGCDCPQDAITQGIITVEYDYIIEYTFCEEDLPANCAQVSFNTPDEFCETDPVYFLPTPSNEGVLGSWDPTSLNPAGQGGNILQATFTPNDECEPEVTLNIPVVENQTPTFAQIGPLCESDPLYTMPTTSNEGIPGTWDVGPLFNPSLYAGQTVTVNFTPDNPFCTDNQSMNITVEEETEPTFIPLAPLCESDPPVALPILSNNGINGNWQGGNFFDPFGLGGQTITLTFVPDGGQCAVQTTMDISVNEQNTPVFDPVGPLCENDPSVFLPFTSNNGIDGTWDPFEIDPAGQGGNTITATFTPDFGECAEVVTMDIDIEAADEPTFDPVGPLCENDAIVILNDVSNEGIPGTWNPPFIDPDGQGGQIISAQFTPDFGECASPTIIDIEIIDSQSPTFPAITDVCELDNEIVLPTTSNEGVEGTWVPATIDPNGQGGNSVFAEFFPFPDECAESVSIFVDIDLAVEPTFAQVGPLCENESPVNLPNFSFENIEGTWSIAVIDPAGQGGNTITTTFTPEFGECAISTTMYIDITAETEPTFDPIDPLCESDDPIVLETLSNNGITGTWDVGATFDPNGQGGQIVTINFTPDNGQCAAMTTLDIEVEDQITPTFDPIGPLCEDDPAVSLPDTSNDGIMGSWDAGSTFDPSGLGGSTTPVTFTPDAGECADNFTENVVVNELPDLTELDKDCNSGLADYYVDIETTADDVTSSEGTVTDNMDGTFTIDNIPSGTDISLIITNTNTGCNESFTIVAPGCDCPPIDPPTGMSVTICENEMIPALTASASGNLEVDWYDAASGGNLLLENSTTYTPTQAGDFYVEAVDGMSECTSIDRTLISLTIIEVDTFLVPAMTCDANMVGFDTTVYTTAQCDSVVVTEWSLSPSFEEMNMASSCDPNEAGLDTLFLTTQFGCDSLVITETVFQNAVETLIPATTCDPMMVGLDTVIFTTANCDSLVITETTLLPSDEVMVPDFTCDPMEEGFDTLHLTNQFGCDSVVIVETILSPSHEFSFTSMTCNPSDVGIDTSQFVNQFGCDSLIITTTNLAPSYEIPITESSCDMADVGFDTLFLMTQFSCDSLIITETIFSPADTTFDSDTSCDPMMVGIDTIVFNLPDCDSIVILTTSLLPSTESYDQIMTCDPMMVGLDTMILMNTNGCDSLAITETMLAPSEETMFTEFSCNPANVGFDTLFLTTQFNCDSLVITETEFAPIAPTFETAMTCDAAQVGIDTIIINAGGCDSMVIISTSFLPPSEEFFTAMSCDPAQVGTDTVTLVNQFGCDSLVITETEFMPIQPTFETAMTCDDALVGTDTVTLVTTFGCDSLIITETSLSPSDETPMVAFSCNLNEIGFDTVTLVNQFGCDSLIITETQFDPLPPSFEMGITCNPAQAGVDTLIFNSNGCDSVVILTTILADDTQSNFTDTSCDPNEVGIDTVFLTNSNGCDSLVITTTTLNDSDEMTFVTTTCEPSEVGFDTLFLTNINGCDSLIITETELVPSVDGFEYEITPPTCNTDLGIIEILTVNGGTGPYLYSIDGGNTFVSETTFPNLPEGNYEIFIEDAEGCRFMESLYVPAPFDAIVTLASEAEIQLGDSYILNTITNISDANIANITWLPETNLSCSDCLTPTATPTETTTYQITITDTDGCVVTAEITVFVESSHRFYIPNVFSPNDDGVNDRFIVFGNPKQVVQVRTFQIFSRWGELLYEARNISPNTGEQGWDGTFNGERLNAGVYMFKADLIFADGTVREFVGDVTLVR